MNFVNRIAEVCEEQDHHPDVHIYNYRWVGLDFSTHSIGGLSENDFIMAAKVNQLAAGFRRLVFNSRSGRAAFL